MTEKNTAQSFITGGFSVTVAGLTDKGIRRSENQDVFAVDTKLGLCLVCDGMGGTREGRAVAEAAAKAIPIVLAKALEGRNQGEIAEKEAINLLAEAILSVNGNLTDWEAEGRNLSGSGSTLVMIWFLSGKALVAHMGDSRVYRFRKGIMEVLTHDHTLAAMLVELGRIDAEEAKTHPGRNRLSRYMGIKPGAEPDISVHEPEEGDLFLLCSDGLWGVVPTEVMETILEGNDDYGMACSKLIKEANQRGGPDNITALIASVKPIGDKTDT